MFKKIITFSFLFIWPVTAYCQGMLQGKVIDQSKGESIPLSNIWMEGTHFGTVSNMEGEFALKVDAIPIRLKISHIGYETKVINIPEINKSEVIIQLKPALATMVEVIVTNDFEVNLVEKAIQKMLTSEDEDIIGKAFYRQLTQSDSVYTEFVETFYRAKITPNGINGWNLEQGRYAIIPQDSLREALWFRNFSGFSLTKLVREDKPINKTVWPLQNDAHKYYNFYLRNTYTQDNKDVYLIAFEPKSNLKKPGYTGTVAIVDSSYTIQELIMTISNPTFNPVTTYGAKTSSENVMMKFAYRNNFIDESGHFYPNIIAIDLWFDYIKKKGLFGKIDFKRRVHTRSLMYFFDYETDGISQFFTDDYFKGVNDETIDINRINETGYNPTFWENNSIIKRTPVELKVIQSFEKYGSFGTMFNDDREQE